MLVLEPEASFKFLFCDQDMVAMLENERMLDCCGRKKGRERRGKSKRRIYRRCVIDYE